MSNSANDVPEMTPEKARNAASLVAYLLDTDVEQFMREFFPHGFRCLLYRPCRLYRPFCSGGPRGAADGRLPKMMGSGFGFSS